jgi:acyl-CoA reductase-like NAD-dependent aldehyde dehydrogenase
VARARAVFDDGAWASMPGAQRARILWRVADLKEHADELARLETRDQGQPLSISAGFSVPIAADRRSAARCARLPAVRRRQRRRRRPYLQALFATAGYDPLAAADNRPQPS